MGMMSSLGHGVDSTYAALLGNVSAATFVPEWAEVDGLHSHVAAWVPPYDCSSIPRVKRRTMSRMSELMCMAADEAIAQAQITPEAMPGLRIMLIVGSTTGSPITLEESQRKFHESGSFKGLLSTLVFKCMSHSVAANLGSYWDFQGPVMAPSSACSTGAQAVVIGKQMIESGYCDIAIVGGADECHITSCYSFDAAFAASRGFNHSPEIASRPFDKNRDGIVVSEGASVLVLESETSLARRSVKSYGRIRGAAQWCDGRHMCNPNLDAMVRTIAACLDDADIKPSNIGYVNAHATSTRIGDLAEAQAIYKYFGPKMPISSFKGHMGHSFAASGSSETILCLKMLADKKIIGTRNLEVVDPEMPGLDFVRELRAADAETVLSNSFAFGGMNISLVLTR